MMDILEQVLKTLGFPVPVRAVYIDLVLHGRAPARIIAARLGMTRTSVYDQLKALLKKGLIVERDMEGKTEFAIHDVADLGELLAREEKKLGDERATLERERDHLFAAAHSIEPKIRFFTGREAILVGMHDMLWDEQLTLQVVWPYDEMFRMLGEEALRDFDRKRIRNSIRLKTVWTGTIRRKENSLWGEDETGVERRIAPPGFSPSMGYTLYGDKALFISSAKEAFGFMVVSGDFASLMRQQFELLWQVSRPSAKKVKGKK